MRNQLHGIYAHYIQEYIDFKRGLGFKYKTEATIFALFDRFTVKRIEKKVGITQDLAEAWSGLNPNESSSYKYHRCVCLNQLASYLCKIGIPSYVLQLPPNKSVFTPYVFSKDEVHRVFAACDGIVGKKRRMDGAIIILPALIRLLYATGLRISEALSLKAKDVNTDDHYLVVRDSKNGKERMIPISLSLSAVLKEYYRQKMQLPLSGSVSLNFFITLAGRSCTSDHVRKWFTKILQNAGISKSDTGPRLHDLRHTFSVHALAMMAESGIDLYCSLPILSTYLGHQSLEATNAYVRLTAEMYPELLKDVDFASLNVFPTPPNYAAY